MYILSSGMLFGVFSNHILPLTVVNVLSSNDSLVHSRIRDCPVKILNVFTFLKDFFLVKYNTAYTLCLINNRVLFVSKLHHKFVKFETSTPDCNRIYFE